MSVKSELRRWRCGIFARVSVRSRVSSCLNVSAIRRSLSSFDTFRCRSLEAMPIEMIDGLLPDLLQRARRLELDLALGVAYQPAASVRAFSFISSRNRSASERLRETISAASLRACAQQFRRLGVDPFELLLRLPRVVERLADRTPGARRVPPAAAARRTSRAAHENQEREDRPDVQTRIGLDQRIHDMRPFTVVQADLKVGLRAGR